MVAQWRVLFKRPVRLFAGAGGPRFLIFLKISLAKLAALRFIELKAC